MKTNTLTLEQTLSQLVNSYTEQFQQQHQQLMQIEHDPNWPSPCEQHIHQNGLADWQPTEIQDELSFDNVEQALAINFHSDIKHYFTQYYSEPLPMQAERGKLELLFAWNKDDFERLQQNLIGHVLMKQKLKQSITLFFAVTDDDDYMISIKNDTGEVYLERVGCEVEQKLAENITEFLQHLTPVVTD